MTELARHSQYMLSQNMKGLILPKPAVLNKHLRRMSETERRKTTLL